MYNIYRQSRSDHRRGFTGTLLRSEIRTRGGHDSRALIRLIPIERASEYLGLPVTTLELVAKNGLVLHYQINGHLLFEPVELDGWVRLHHIDILETQQDIEYHYDK